MTLSAIDETRSAAKESSSKRAGGFLLAFLLILYFLHYALIKIYPVDEGSTLVTASMMNAGKILYRDLFCLIPPGAYTLEAFLLRTTGPSLWIGRVVVGMLNLSGAVLLFAALRRRLGTWTGLASLTLFASLWASYNHIVNKNTFAFLLMLPLVLLLTDRSQNKTILRLRPFLLGALVAGVGLFKHNVAFFMAAAVAASLVYEARLNRLDDQEAGWGSLHALFKMAAGGVFILLPVFAVMLWEGNLFAMFRSLFYTEGIRTYVQTHTTQVFWFIPPRVVLTRDGLDAWFSYVLMILPLAAGTVSLVLWARSRRSRKEDKVLLFSLGLFSFALLATLFPRMERSHVNMIYASFPVILVCLGEMIARSFNRPNLQRRAWIASLLMISTLGTVGIVESFMILDGYTVQAEVPYLEGIALRPEEAARLESLYDEVNRRIGPSESLQLLSDYYLIYYLTDKTPASPFLGGSLPHNPNTSRLYLNFIQGAFPDVILSDLPPILYPDTPLSLWVFENYRDDGYFVVGSPDDPDHIYFNVLRRNDRPIYAP